MTLKCLGSASSGNCYIITNDNEAIIIEMGVPFKKIKEAMNFEISKIKGVCLSHEHQDHSRFIWQAIETGINVYSSSETLNAIKLKTNHFAKPISNMKLFNICNFNVLPFDLIHDVHCTGFIINHEETGNIVFLTDTAYSTFRFANIKHWLIECNYSQDLLDKNTENGNISDYVRKRIMRSHMSIETVKNLLNANDLSQTQNICLLHLSNSNSDGLRFKKEIEELTGKQVFIADKGTEINLNNNPF